MEDEKLPLEKRLALDSLRYGVQMHQMQKPKTYYLKKLVIIY